VRVENLDDATNGRIFYRARKASFPVKDLKIGQTGLISWLEYKDGRANANHEKFMRAIRQACYRAKPMKFRVAQYDDYEYGCAAVLRVE